MATGKMLDPAIMAQFTGSETFYRYGLAGEALFMEENKSIVSIGEIVRNAKSIRVTKRRHISASDLHFFILTLSRQKQP